MATNKMHRHILILFGLLLAASSAWGQCGSAGHLVLNGLTGSFDCTANAGVPPSGAAGGVLGGTFPDPTFAGGASFPADSTLFLNGAGVFTAPGTANARITFSNVASATMTLTGVATKAVVSCWDSTVSPARLFFPDSVEQTDANTLTFNFVPNATGYCDGSTGVGLTGATGATGAAGAAGPISATGGSGSQLQYRIDATTLGGLAGSSVSGPDLTLGGNVTVGTTVIDQTHGPTTDRSSVFLSGYWTDPNTGSFLNDLTPGGLYTGFAASPGATYTVIIDAAGTPDTFKWRKNSGSFTTAVAITGAAQTLSNGVTVTFAATTGHTLNDEWDLQTAYELGSSQALYAGHSAFGAQGVIDQITAAGTTYAGVPFVMTITEDLQDVNQYFGEIGGLNISASSSNSQLEGGALVGADITGAWYGSTGNPFRINGVSITAYNNGTTTVGHLTAVAAFPSTQTGATSTTVEGFETHLSNNGGTIGTWIGVHLNEAPFNSGTVTNQYGIKIEDIAQGTNKWAIKTGAGRVEFDDLKTTGAATGKKTVCVDTATGILYASSTGTDCSN